MNSSGTTPLIFDRGLSLGGEGIVVYSVKENEFKLGVRGLLSPLVSPLTLTPFDIVCVVQLGQLLCVLCGCWRGMLLKESLDCDGELEIVLVDPAISALAEQL